MSLWHRGVNEFEKIIEKGRKKLLSATQYLAAVDLIE